MLARLIETALKSTGYEYHFNELGFFEILRGFSNRLDVVCD